MIRVVNHNASTGEHRSLSPQGSARASHITLESKRDQVTRAVVGAVASGFRPVACVAGAAT
jgi:hypothetical protein